MELARADGYVPTNPLAGRSIRLPRAENHGQGKCLGLDECRALASMPAPWGPYVALGLLGLGVGEVLGLTRSSLRGGALHVEQQRLRREGVKSKLKTRARRRVIPLTPEMETYILARAGDVFLVQDARGMPPAPGTVIRYFKQRVKEHTGIDGVTTHTLRHTFASHLESELEAPRPVVSALLGHAESGMTDHYSKSRLEAQRRWVAKWWEALALDAVPLSDEKRPSSAVQI